MSKKYLKPHHPHHPQKPISEVIAESGKSSDAIIARMAQQMDEIYQRVTTIETFLSDLAPGIGNASKEVGETVNELRIRYERDETIELIKKVGDNIPTFVELLGVMNALKGMTTDFLPNIPKLLHELNDAISDLRVRFERDETLQLLKKVGDNIPMMLELLTNMQAIRGLVQDIVPSIQNVNHELGETINELRSRYERDEVVELIKKMGDHIPTFLQLANTMDAVKGMVTDFAPAIIKINDEVGETVSILREKFERDEVIELLKKMGDNIPMMLDLMSKMDAINGFIKEVAPNAENIFKEISPTINMLREALEKEELLVITKQFGENLPTFQKLLAFLTTFEKTGNLDLTLEESLTRETQFLMKGLLKCTRRTMHELQTNPMKPSAGGLVSSVFDSDVQWGMLMMTTLLKNMHACMTSDENQSEPTEADKRDVEPQG
jgi:nitrate reductase assembly molybdenum cofactor insertion protein NarJ